MIPYGTLQEVEAVLGRTTTWAEAAWFRYSAAMPDWCLLSHSYLISGIISLVVPLPVILLEQLAPAVALRYKLQPQEPPSLSPAAILRYIRSSGASVLLMFVPHVLMYLVTFKIAGIRTGISLPSPGEMVAKVVVYALLEDYLSYWMHRFLHTTWGYTKLHHVHHEFTAPSGGFVGAHSHWAELVIGGIPTIVGPIIAPCHITTHWLWFTIRGIELMDTHSGYEFPFNPTKLIPFYGGAEFHDYHHRVVGRRSNFAPFFTYCDYIYGTNKGYRYHKANILAERKKLASEDNMVNRGSDRKKDE